MMDLLTTHFGDSRLPLDITTGLIKHFGSYELHGPVVFSVLLMHNSIDELYLLVEELYSEPGYCSSRLDSVSILVDTARQCTFEIVLDTNHIPIPALVKLIAEFAADLS